MDVYLLSVLLDVVPFKNWLGFVCHHLSLDDSTIFIGNFSGCQTTNQIPPTLARIRKSEEGRWVFFSLVCGDQIQRHRMWVCPKAEMFQSIMTMIQHDVFNDGILEYSFLKRCYNGLRAFPLTARKPGATRQGCAVDSWILKYLVVMSWFATHFNVFQAGDIISTVHFGDQGCQICFFLNLRTGFVIRNAWCWVTVRD